MIEILKSTTQLLPLRSASFFNWTFDVPENCKYLTLDYNGDIYAHVEMPIKTRGYWRLNGLGYLIANVNYEGNWEDSLILL